MKEQLHIKELLARFMAGETTLDEERMLGDWLRTHEVGDELKPYQLMFAAFDAGLPPVKATPKRRIVWWHWAAVAAVACLLITVGVRLVTRLTTAQQPPMMAQEQPVEKTPAAPAMIASHPDDLKLAEIRQSMPIEARATQVKSKKRKKASTRMWQPSAKDSIEVARAKADLELAESEYLAEQIELEQQLQQLRQIRSQTQNGWHYTYLPCQ
ncbi:MAG: hypothetical protein IJ808_09635 [Muribaculaceae bacterium]|nr:hypothetical protein [Muribaculaceae bacterium]